mgnify:CR=1 FL=1
MPSLKDIKTQINSVVSTKKITTAMKMVAASKLRRSQEKAVAARPYSSRLEEMLSSLASSAASGEGIIKLLTGTGNDKSYMVVPVSADRGLCGGFNSSINRETTKFVNSLEKEGKHNASEKALDKALLFSELARNAAITFSSFCNKKSNLE